PNPKLLRWLLHSSHKSTQKGAIIFLPFPVPSGSSFDWKTLASAATLSDSSRMGTVSVLYARLRIS
ncbi:MAG: hypothetical protein WB758_17730, partial [Candidatus Sulfotelmatobacter sp.]